MTETEKKALALLNECGWGGAHLKRTWNPRYEALCRAIEQHEAFKREVSDAVLDLMAAYGVNRLDVERFIIAKPDPLVEVMQAWWDTDGYASIDTFRAALAKHGLKLERIDQ